MLRVELAQGEGPVAVLMLDEERNKVSDLLTRAGVSLDGRKIRVNGETEDADFRLSDGDLVMLYQKVAGGNV